jgi:hypothetical protein
VMPVMSARFMRVVLFKSRRAIRRARSQSCALGPTATLHK